MTEKSFIAGTDAIVSPSCRDHMNGMTFLMFILFLLLGVFVLWNIWNALRDLGDTSEDDRWGD